jgi:pyruvate ferredoxin oxidoreductase beta subunit/2-oxoisovalerate ferredoxin oxidoreductase beta subunit
LAAAASGLRRALDAQGRSDTQVVVLAGDGGTYDIGLQCLSSAAERNEDMLYVCLDNEGYMNTGAQKSSSTPLFARTSSTPEGKPTRKKNLTGIMAAHGVPYAATASVGFMDDMLRKVEKAKAIRGFRILTLLVPCIDGWGLDDDGGLQAARYAVECGAFPLYEVEDGNRYTLNYSLRPRKVGDYLALQKRYRGLAEAEVTALQAEVDRGWEWLMRLIQAEEVQALP